MKKADAMIIPSLTAQFIRFFVLAVKGVDYSVKVLSLKILVLAKN